MKSFAKVLGCSAALVLLAGAAWISARAEGSPDNKCELAGMLCTKDGVCEGKCAEVCAQSGKLLTAVRSNLGARMKAQFGESCPCTSGACSEEHCPACEFLKTKVFAPLLREKVASRLTSAPINLTHVARGGDGKLVEAPCTFIKGETCPHCVRELSDATWQKANELLFDPMGAFVKAVHERVVSQIKADGRFMCPCLTGECKPGECPACKEVKTTVFEPMLKQRVAERLADLQKDFTHVVKAEPGQTRTVVCTFLRGEPCPHCADEFAAAVRTKMTEFASAKK